MFAFLHTSILSPAARWTLSLSSNIGDVGAKELAGAIGASDWLTRADLLAAIPWRLSMDDDELDRRETWLCALAVRCCRAGDLITLPDELLTLLRAPLAPWSLLECAADAAEALTAQASNAPVVERRARLQPLWEQLALAGGGSGRTSTAAAADLRGARLDRGGIPHRHRRDGSRVAGSGRLTPSLSLTLCQTPLGFLDDSGSAVVS